MYVFSVPLDDSPARDDPATRLRPTVASAATRRSFFMRDLLGSKGGERSTGLGGRKLLRGRTKRPAIPSAKTTIALDPDRRRSRHEDEREERGCQTRRRG